MRRPRPRAAGRPLCSDGHGHTDSRYRSIYRLSWTHTFQQRYNKDPMVLPPSGRQYYRRIRVRVAVPALPTARFKAAFVRKLPTCKQPPQLYHRTLQCTAHAGRRGFTHVHTAQPQPGRGVSHKQPQCSSQCSPQFELLVLVWVISLEEINEVLKISCMVLRQLLLGWFFDFR